MVGRGNSLSTFTLASCRQLPRYIVCVQRQYEIVAQSPQNSDHGESMLDLAYSPSMWARSWLWAGLIALTIAISRAFFLASLTTFYAHYYIDILV